MKSNTNELILVGLAIFAATLSGTVSEAAVISMCDTTIPAPPRTCTAGQLTDGWDGPGLGSYDFEYFIGNPSRLDGGIPPGFTQADVDAAFQSAAASWSSVIDVTFSPAAGFGTGEIDLYFHTMDQSIPFDGPWNPSTGTGSVFAHAWGPPDITFPVASGVSNPGNIHMDIDEQWVTSGAPNVQFPTLLTSIDIDLESIILHELGHALGLGHENSMGSGLGAPVMQSFYNGPWRTLTQDDIDGARMLYAAAGSRGMPEPSSLALIGLGFAALARYRRRHA